MRVVVVILLVLAAGPAAAAGRTRIAVTDVRPIQGVQQGTATILSDMIVSETARRGYDVVSQSDIGIMIGFEKQKRMLGCSEESSCLAEIGGALGVEYVIAGQVGQLGSRYRISLLAVDAKRARVVARASQFCDPSDDALARAAEKTIEQLLESVNALATASAVPKAPAAVATPPRTEAAKPKAEVAAAPARPKADLAAAPARPGRDEAAAGASISATATRPAWRRQLPAYATMGTGGALVIAGLVTGQMARSALSDLKAQQGSYGYYDYFPDQESKVKRLALTSDVLTATGLVTAGVGGWMWWRSRRAPVAVAPLVAPGEAGLALAGRF